MSSISVICHNNVTFVKCAWYTKAFMTYWLNKFVSNTIQICLEMVISHLNNFPFLG